MSAITNISMNRRQFLGMTAAGASVFVLGISLPLGRFARADSGSGVINAFIGIGTDGTVTFQNPFVEMGQGTYTSIPAVIAEELDVEMAVMQVVQAPHGDTYKIMFDNTRRFTGGSLSVRSSYDTMRKAGATARAMLINAAAADWGVSADECATEPGFVVHKKTGRRRSYGELATLAAGLQPPAEITLKDPSSFRLIGRPVKRTDSLAKSTGRAEFGIDIRLDGMVYAAVKQSPVTGGRVVSFDGSAVMKEPGVIAVEEIPGGVAVIATLYWQAKTALEKLPVQFEDGEHRAFSDGRYREKILGRLDDAGIAAENTGDVIAALQGCASTIQADYVAPFLAHATMEPMNCTARIRDGRCTIWAPNQAVDSVAETAAGITGLPLDAIEVHTPYLGGGFGRRFITDYVTQAVTLANKLKGRPVKVLWTREEDMQHDFYRPMTAARYRAGFDEQGNPVAIHATNAGDGPFRQLMPASIPESGVDSSVVDGAINQPYEIPNKRVDYVLEPAPVPVGFWRSVGNSVNAFFKESFVDEMAHAVGMDPVDFRRKLLAEHPRYRKVLDTAVAMAGWKGKPWTATDGKRHAMGIALHESFNSLVAEVAEISVEDGKVRVHRVYCAVDCGFAVNPAIVVMQMESGIAYGLSAALGEEITFENGRVVQANFDSYPLLPPLSMPAVEVEIINSNEALGGIGEPATPPIAPAVCNAIFSLTGQRIRTLPLGKTPLQGA